jgi:hypothetical protein
MEADTEKDPFIGQRFGKVKQVEVVSRNTVGLDNQIRPYIVKCVICEQDPELFGNGLFSVAKRSLLQGSLPCGCSKRYLWSEAQHAIRGRRLCESVGFVYRGLAEWKGTASTKVLLACKDCGNEWGARLDNLIAGKGCLGCLKPSRNPDYKIRRTIGSEEDHIKIFMGTGKFEAGTVFKRCERKDGQNADTIRWKVVCPICSFDAAVKEGKCSGIFEGTYGNLSRGSRPCRCPSTKFDKSLDAYFYVLRANGIHDFTGYGISTNIKSRFSKHRSNLLRAGFVISEFETFVTTGEIAIAVEKLVKQNFEMFSQNVEAFKKEATLSYLYDDVVAFVENEIVKLESESKIKS